MRLPFFNFGGSRNETPEEDQFVVMPNELLNPPEDEEEEEEEEEEQEEEHQPGDKEEEPKYLPGDDEMLKVFTSVDEDFVDNSDLTSELEDVPAEELVQELRVLASAFGIRINPSDEEAV